DMQEFALWTSGSPYLDIGLSFDLRLIKFPDECRQYVRVLQVVVIVRTVQVGRHQTDEIATILRVVGLTHLDARNLGDRIGLVRWLKRSGEQHFLLHRLRCELWVYTR